jgi:PAS domain S-box-containing protein
MFPVHTSAAVATSSSLLAGWISASDQSVHALLISALLMLAASAMMLLRSSRKQAEIRRVAEQRYATLFHSLREAVFVSTKHGQLIDFNEAFIALLGYSREELLSINIGRDLYADPAQRNVFLQQLEHHGFLHHAEWQIRRKDGSTLWVLENSSAHYDPAGNVLQYQGFLLDVTDKKHAEEALHRRNAELTELYDEVRRAYEDLRQTQEQLLQSEKMSAVGQLIAGVAHELNNPLTAVLGYAQLLESEPLPEPSREFVTKLYRQTQRTQRIVQNLLSFARQRKPQRVPVDVARVIDDMFALRGYDLRINNIDIRRDFAPNLPSVLADPHQLEQVFLNIINNAADAMLGASSRGVLRVKVFMQHGKLVAEFHDSGPGVVDPHKIFDPFFTTKAVGKGTGLGLSICYGIVKEHGGEIVAANHEQGGAQFRVVLLPIAVPANPRLAPEPVLQEVGGVLDCRILLVDDEEPVLDFEKEVLTKAGATVSIAKSGEDALAMLKHGRFDVVVTDSKMPGTISGSEVCRWIQQNRPDLHRRTIVTLSNAAETDLTEYLASQNIPALVKPFDCADLIQTIRSVHLRTARAIAAGR